MVPENGRQKNYRADWDGKAATELSRSQKPQVHEPDDQECGRRQGSSAKTSFSPSSILRTIWTESAPTRWTRNDLSTV